MNASDFMLRAIALSAEGAANGGGPFGAVVVKDGRIIGEGTNDVVPGKDPTAHGEIVAIRNACVAIGSHDLSGAVMFTSCEPCPMCLAAIWWARISKIVYGNTREDATAIGFDDDVIYDEVSKPLAARTLPIERAHADQAIVVFQDWARNPNRIMY